MRYLPRRSKTESAGAAFALVCALAGAVGILAATPQGIGLSRDSLVYVLGARNLLSGEGFSMPPGNEPITHLAPLYSFLLALPGPAGVDPVESARWLAAGLMGLNIFLVSRLVLLIGDQGGPVPGWIAAGTAALALAARPMWEVHLMAWTEPAFLGMCLAGSWLMTRYLATLKRAWLLPAGGTVGLSIVTRYAGLSMWAAGCAVLCLVGRRPATRKVRDAVEFSAVSLAPILIWAGRNALTAGTATGRSIVPHPVEIGHLQQALAAAASWLMVSEQASGWIKAAALAATGLSVAAGALFWSRRDAIRVRGLLASIPAVVQVTAISAMVYPLFLLLSISLVDRNTPLDQRIMSPLFVLLLVPLAFGLCAWDGLIGKRSLMRGALVFLLGFWCLGSAGRSYPLVGESYREGLEFSSRRWRESELVRSLRESHTAGAIYSNSPDAVYFLAGKPAKGIPRPFFRVTQRENPDYQRGLSEMRRDLERGGILVCFNMGDSPAGRETDALVRSLELVPLRDYRDGTIYTR